MQAEDQVLRKATQEPVQLQEHQKNFLQVIKFSDCSGDPHLFHKECVENHFASTNSLYYKCVTCQKQYGTRTGGMPPGKMSWTTDPQIQLAGYEGLNYGISIYYDFPNGVKDGVPYSGTRRQAFLPGNEEGKEALGLLITSFERRLTFVVGTSVTTGRSNCVVWAGVHHKTNTHGGTSNFAYPDETYFARLKGELKDRGVTPDDIKQPVKLTGTITIN